MSRLDKSERAERKPRKKKKRHDGDQREGTAVNRGRKRRARENEGEGEITLQKRGKGPRKVKKKGGKNRKRIAGGSRTKRKNKDQTEGAEEMWFAIGTVTVSAKVGDGEGKTMGGVGHIKEKGAVTRDEVSLAKGEKKGCKKEGRD